MLFLIILLPAIPLLLVIRRQIWKRSQVNIAAWPTSLQYYGLKSRVRLVFSNAGWTVENLSIGDLADLKMKKDDYQMLVKCVPAEIHIGPAKIRDLGFYKFSATSQSLVVCVMCDMPDIVRVDEAAQRGVYLIHYTDLADILNQPVSTISKRFDTSSIPSFCGSDS